MGQDQPGSLPLLDAAVAAIGGRPRRGQADMARAVDQALDSRTHLAVQAGTGTGKSLAYLVPALRHAQETDSTVVVSTATIALQRQLVERDLPRLAEALADRLDHRPTFAIQKGRGNYVCLHRIAAAEEPEPQDALVGEEDLGRLGREMRRVRDWAQETETGDREDLDPGVSDLVWRQVSVTARECLGASRCPHAAECFAEAARRRARDVDVVVTNHALLAIDAMADGQVLPDHDVVIVDEAHELTDRFTATATSAISPTVLRLAATRANKLDADTSELQNVADAWERFAPTQPHGRWRGADDHARTLLATMRDELWSISLTVRDAPAGEATEDPEQHGERLTLVTHLVDLHDTVVRMLDSFEDDAPTDVVWLGERATISVAPLSVAPVLADRLFAESTVVLTSATLALGGRFDTMAAAWGLAKGTWRGIDVGTPFDPAHSGILYVATHLPDPGRGELPTVMIDEMAELITAAGGRTLGLFSSRRAAEQAAGELRGRLPFPIYLQGEEAIGTLVGRFHHEENSCLFGTLSLWQGVDVPGRSCLHVMIDRIPFPRPDDPLSQARKEAAQAEGRNGFMEVAAAHAALLLAQGAGRLLRSVEDRGVVSVLDRRLVTKRYGSFLRASLPPFWETTDQATTTGALKRLVAAREP